MRTTLIRIFELRISAGRYYNAYANVPPFLADPSITHQTPDPSDESRLLQPLPSLIWSDYTREVEPSAAGDSDIGVAVAAARA
jgi:hypothetical protein